MTRKSFRTTPRKLTLLAATGAALTFAAPVAAQSTDILLNCSACHVVGTGSDRKPAAGTVFPDLNGQPVRYLERQLEAFREGRRQHRQMQLTAMALEKGAGAMARLYADAPHPDLAPPEGRADRVPALVTQGDWERGLPPCASCHALEADGARARTAPRLHGQPEAYLATQLCAYANGERRSDPMGRMRAFSARLEPGEIADLAAYYAGWRRDDTAEATTARKEETDG